MLSSIGPANFPPVPLIMYYLVPHKIPIIVRCWIRPVRYSGRVLLTENRLRSLLDVDHSRQILQIRITRDYFSFLVLGGCVHNRIGHR
jgi:hypothetical protein